MSKNKQKKCKGKTTANAPQCLTLMKDEITRCGQPATEGRHGPRRCKVHNAQYRTLRKKYKHASKVVDNVKGGSLLPTWVQIGRYKSRLAALEKARWVRKYLEAVQVEKAGREIHQKRFFLKGECTCMIGGEIVLTRVALYIFSGRWSQAPPRAAREKAGESGRCTRCTSTESR
ncbi:hypothetical protein HD554DRAFT_2140877 [Boletus coccyginus]|nr:hypothetical protein HD554DRAFT_2140877 [Boletus coccyginus]